MSDHQAHGCRSTVRTVDRNLGLLTKYRANVQHKDANKAHFTGSDNLCRTLKTIAEASKPSIPKSFIDKEYGINDMDREVVSLAYSNSALT